MRNKSLNYNRIAGDYNLRYQKDHRQGTLDALRRILSKNRPKHVLEVGCGTCHWLQGLRNGNPCNFFGVDKFLEMLKQVQKPSQLLLCQGLAEKLPFKPETFDLIYCVNAIHHFSKPELFIMQANRLLRPGGTLAIIGMNPRDPRNNWYIYNFFEGVRDTDLSRFPDWNQVMFWLNKVNFENIILQDIEFIHDPKTAETVLEDPFLRKNACSQLALLSNGAYRAGLDKLREHAKSKAEIGFCYENDIVLSMLHAKKPKIISET